MTQTEKATFVLIIISAVAMGKTGVTAVDVISVTLLFLASLFFIFIDERKLK
jgi:hypothetical protein